MRVWPFTFLFLFGASSVVAQHNPSIVVHDIQSQSQCESYRDFWGFWLVTECQNHFSAMRDGIESALIESHAFEVLDPTAAAQSDAVYEVYGTVTGLGSQYRKTSDTGYCISDNVVRAAVDIRVVNRSTGAIIFGGNVQKSVEQSSNVTTDRADRCHAERGRPYYEIVQRELSLAVARSIVFQIQPLTVSGVEGRQIRLNRGKPLLSLGSMIKVADSKGFPHQYRITGTINNQSIAEPVGNFANVEIGALAEYIESDDNEANARRFQKTDLP